MFNTFRERLQDATTKILTKYRLTRKKLLLIFFGIVAFIILLDGLNKPHLSPFNEKLRMDYPCNIVMEENGGVICDRQHSRLILLNQKREVRDMISLTISGSPINWAGDVVIFEDNIYVLGAVYANRGMYLKSESVEVYSLSGKHRNHLLIKEYDETSMETQPHLLTLWMEEGKLYIAKQEDQIFSIQSIDASGNIFEEKKYKSPEKMLSAQMIGTQLVTYDRKKQLYYPDESSGELIIPVEVAEYYRIFESYEKTGDFLDKFPQIPLNSKIIYQFGEENQIKNIFCLSETENKIFQYHISKDEISEFSELTISPWWAMKNFFFWMFTAYVIALLISGLIWLLMIKKKFWEWRGFLALVLVALMITGIYTYYSSNRIKSIYTKQISMLDKQISDELQNGYKDVLQDVGNSGMLEYANSEIGKRRLNELENFLSSMSAACGKEVGFFIDVLAVESDEEIRMLADSQKEATISFPVNRILPDFSGSETVVFNEADAKGKYLMERSNISINEGKTRFIVEAGCFEGNLYKQVQTEAINLLVNLLALLITFWISFSVLKDIPRSIKAYKEKTQRGDPDAPVSLTGVFTFLQQMVSLIDVVILVYVIKSMLSPEQEQYLSVISAVMMALFSLGALLGNLLFFQLRIRIGERKIGIFASVGGIVSFLMMAYAIYTTRFIFFIFGKFFSGIFVGSHLLVLSRGLPLESKNEEIRVRGLNKNQQAYIAGAVLSTLLAGYLSEYIHYSAVYLAGALLCVPMLLIAFWTFKPGINMEVRNWFMTMKKESKGLIGFIRRMPWMFYKTPKALSFILLYTFPFVLTNGYQQYLFPLFSASAGISALLLSNISVFGQAIAYLTNKPVMEITRNWDRIKTMTGAMGILCACFVCFYLSPNIWWAITVLFVQNILFRIPRVGTAVHLSELAEEAGYDPKTVQPTYYSIESIFTSVQPSILNKFVSLGVNFACAALGVFCSIFISIFAVKSSKRPIKKELIQVDDEE